MGVKKMEKLAATNTLIVRQKKEWGEILTGFETKNKYVVCDESGAELYAAYEEGGNLLLRWFLKALRPFQMVVADFQGQCLLRVIRPFRFFFYTAEVFDGTGKSMGKLTRRFSILRRIYSVTDASGEERFQLFGPLLHPWTFEIQEQDQVVGKITKKWSGLGKEMFTDADNFGVTFPAGWRKEQKALFLGAVFLIDFAHFENKGN